MTDKFYKVLTKLSLQLVLDSLQKVTAHCELLEFTCKRMIPQRDLSYTERNNYLGLETLEERRQKAGHLFMAGVMNGHVSDFNILASLNFNTACLSSRNNVLLKDIKHHRTDYGKNSPLSRIIGDFKEVEHLSDFHLSKENFKEKLKSLVLQI
ncbi:CLUMA_CG000361, isoform A [Clunio marinus]|uniref:CLUMA_CG000361, isoform A n=1 Tax=Clunio marinus TaxID=568069 RepID=A0A1J1HGB2_9DIPT|nr:CLUMA_CG000361, isoform A [Clunio marinus]